MITRKVTIHDWDVIFLFAFNDGDLERIGEALLWAKAPDSIAGKVADNVLAGRLNEGFTYSNPWLRRTVFAMGETSSGPEVLDTTVHEIIHILQHISMEDDIDPYGEAIAYLGGNLSHTISDIVCELSCPRCHSC